MNADYSQIRGSDEEDEKAVVASERRQSRRRWFRFSLRSSLLLVVVIAAAIGWPVHKARQQRVAVAALERLGCRVDYDLIGLKTRLTGIERLRKLLGEANFTDVIAVAADGAKISDADLAHLAALPHVQMLDITATPITGAGLAHVRALTQLKQLNLDGAQITAAGASHLRRTE